MRILACNWRVLVFAAALSMLAVVLFSITPALHLLGVEDAGLAWPKEAAVRPGQAWRRLGSRLVVVELATAMVLLVGAGLFGKSLYRLLHVELGIPAGSPGDDRGVRPEMCSIRKTNSASR